MSDEKEFHAETREKVPGEDNALGSVPDQIFGSGDYADTIRTVTDGTIKDSGDSDKDDNE